LFFGNKAELGLFWELQEKKRWLLKVNGWLGTTASFTKTKVGLRFAPEVKGWLGTTASFTKTKVGLRFASPPRGPPISRLPDGKRIKKEP
jgi:hypothetical protein